MNSDEIKVLKRKKQDLVVNIQNELVESYVIFYHLLEKVSKSALSSNAILYKDNLSVRTYLEMVSDILLAAEQRGFPNSTLLDSSP